MPTIGKRILIAALVAVGVAVLLLGAMVVYLTVTEYRPEPVEAVELTGEASKQAQTAVPFQVVSWNIGYGANDAENDFFMDGGKAVLARSEEDVRRNMEEMTAALHRMDAEVVFLQEVDRPSKRSFSMDQEAWLQAFQEDDNEAFAMNYACRYVPYPLPTLGRVESGVMTLNRFAAKEAVRMALPISYSWPISLAQLKRGLLVERVPVAGTERELVLVNLHLEAYAGDAEKQAQTEVLFQFLREEYQKGNYCIAGGDFNCSFENADVYPIQEQDTYVPGVLLTKDLPEGYAFANDTAAPSCRLLDGPYVEQQTQLYIVDGFVVSDNVKVEVVQTQDYGFANSDHNPVLLTATLLDG